MYTFLKGLFWLVASLLLAFYGVSNIAANIEFNRLCETLHSTELAPSAPPAVWIGVVFILMSVIFVILAGRNIVSGVKQWKVDAATSLHGVKLIGIVAETRGARGSSDGNPFQIVDVGVLQPDNSILHFHTPLRIGEQYDVGDFIHVKQYQNDINVLHLAESNEIPADTVRLLKYYPKFWSLGYVGDYFISGHTITGVSTIKINDKRYNTQFDYDKAIEDGFYSGDSGMYYTEKSTSV